MKRFMNKPHGSRRLLFGNKNKRDDRGSAIVIVIISMALIGILASTILWASYLNYRIKINDLKVKNSFYSAETVVEQIVAGVKKDVVSAAVNEAYQEVVSNWDALGTDSNRESYFVMAYIEQVEKNLGVGEAGRPANEYDRTKLEGFVDGEFWTEGNSNGFIVKDVWEDKPPTFKTYEENRAALNGNSSMTIKNICVEFYDSDGLLSIINTDIAIDIPKLRFTQAGTIDRLYSYVLVGDDGIVTADATTIGIDGSIYGGVDEYDKGGIEIGQNSHVTVENAAYIISGGDIVIGNLDPVANHANMINQGAELIVRDLSSNGVGYRTNIYANGLAINGSHLDISGKVYVKNDLVLSGVGSNVSLAGQYFGYGNETGTTLLGPEKDADGNDVLDGDGNVVQVNVNPAEQSSAIVINGKDSTVDLTGLNTLQLAGRAYVSLDDDDNDATIAKPHILMGESISVKSNQIAYLVPPECVGTLDGKTVIGQNPVSFATWIQMVSSLPEYAADGKDFKIVDAGKAATKLGGEMLVNYGIGNITADDLSGVDPDNISEAMTRLNGVAGTRGVRFLYKPEKAQVYLYLIMDKTNAEQYFASYYNVNSNKTSLDSYFNQYASGGIKLKENVQGYTVVGNSMVSVTDAASGDNIKTNKDGENLVQLLSSVTLPEDEEGDGEGGEGDEQPIDPDAYREVSDNITNIESVKTVDELNQLIAQCISNYENLNRNLMEEDTGHYNTVFENLVVLETPIGSAEGVLGLRDYLNNHSGKVEFKTSDGLKAVLVDATGGSYTVADSKLRLVVAIGDVEVKSNFQGLIIASGKITVADNVTCKKDGEGVYSVLQAPNTIDSNVPANVLCNGSGMVESGHEGAETDELGNVNIDYSEIVRYENWIKK